MFLLGILSLFQIAFIPGLILTKLLNIKTRNSIQTFLYSFGLSLYFNYLLICVLTYFKIYTPFIIYFIFIIEIGLIVYLILKKKIEFSLNKTIKDIYYSFRNYLGNLSGNYKILLISSLLMLLFFISIIPINAGTIIYFTDAIHRNNWMMEWASNNFPFNTGHFPQLLPANLSLSYVFMQGAAIEYFPKSIMPLFFISILLIFLDLSIQKKSAVYLLGLILYGATLIVFYGLLFISDASLDIPVSFFGFLTFYAIMSRDNSRFDIRTVLLVAVFAAAAANTKLVGVFLVALSGLWFLFYAYGNRKSISKNDVIKTAIYISIIIIGSLFWYLVKPAQMSMGIGSSEFKPSQGLYESFMYGITMLYYSFGPVLSIILFAALLFALLTKEARYLVLLIIAPLFFVWAFWYSYDYRNMSAAIPFTALASAYGIKLFYEKLSGYFVKREPVSETTKNALINKTFLNVIIVWFLIGVFLFSHTELFFNLGINLSYFFHKYYFEYYRVVYAIEIGFYKYVEYWSGTIQVFAIMLFLFFILKKSKIKLIYFLTASAVIAAALNFTLFTPEKLIAHQKHEKEMVEARNLYFNIYQHISDAEKNNKIISNYSLFCELILPGDAAAECLDEISIDSLKKNPENIQLFFLIDMKKINETAKDFIIQNIGKNYSVLFDNEDFIFLRGEILN
jgi:hypothetical protein